MTPEESLECLTALQSDYESLLADAAEVVRQWESGTIGMLDEACGKLRDNGRDGWWRDTSPVSDDEDD